VAYSGKTKPGRLLVTDPRRGTSDAEESSMRSQAITEFCDVPDCERHPIITGYALSKYNPKMIDQFFHGIDATGDCWELTYGHKVRGGYNYIYLGRRDGKNLFGYAHRLIWEALIGPITDELDHRCYFTACINPDHLDDVPPKKNIERTRSHNNGSKTHCKRGHEFTPENTYERPNGRECWACIHLRRAGLI
jgi:hypothetical protein